MVDIPIFHSPTTAYGNVSGEMELDALPQPLRHFPWPTAWVQQHPRFFTPEQSLIASVNTWPFGGATHLVLMYGILCSSPEDANECARFFERTANFEIEEYLR